MTDQTLLAAVRAAAQLPASTVDATTSQPQETSMAETQNGPAAAPAKATTTAELKAAFPDLCAQIEKESMTKGATAERDRIAGIDKLGKDMPGHDALIANLKADGSTTPEQAAMQLIAADGEIRRNQLKGIKAVEDLTGKIAAAPPADAAAPPAKESATTPEGWAAEYGADNAAGTALRSEFASKEDYVAFKANEHKVRVLGARKSA